MQDIMAAAEQREMVAPVEAEETLEAQLVGTTQENLMLFTTVVKEILELPIQGVITAEPVVQANSVFLLENHHTPHTEIVEDLAEQDNMVMVAEAEALVVVEAQETQEVADLELIPE
jgi:hypothetical protein